jgi:hypothetical protein
MGRRCFDDAAVFANRRVDEERLGVLMGEEIIQRRVEEAGVEMELLLVFGAEGRVGVDNADELRIVLAGEFVEEADDVSMLEADDGDPNGLRLSDGRRMETGENCGDEE